MNRLKEATLAAILGTATILHPSTAEAQDVVPSPSEVVSGDTAIQNPDGSTSITEVTVLAPTTTVEQQIPTTTTTEIGQDTTTSTVLSGDTAVNNLDGTTSIIGVDSENGKASYTDSEPTQLPRTGSNGMKLLGGVGIGMIAAGVVAKKESRKRDAKFN